MGRRGSGTESDHAAMHGPVLRLIMIPHCYLRCTVRKYIQPLNRANGQSILPLVYPTRRQSLSRTYLSEALPSSCRNHAKLRWTQMYIIPDLWGQSVSLQDYSAQTPRKSQGPPISMADATVSPSPDNPTQRGLAPERPDSTDTFARVSGNVSPALAALASVRRATGEETGISRDADHGICASGVRHRYILRLGVRKGVDGEVIRRACLSAWLVLRSSSSFILLPSTLGCSSSDSPIVRL